MIYPHARLHRMIKKCESEHNVSDLKDSNLVSENGPCRHVVERRLFGSSDGLEQMVCVKRKILNVG